MLSNPSTDALTRPLLPAEPNEVLQWLTENCCHHCFNALREGMSLMEQMQKGMFARMIVCRVCGNKRCPKATWHENECSGSNEPGQEGSIFQ
jgi:hypothetical protein